MHNVLISTDRRDFNMALTRGEKLPHGITLRELPGEGDHRFLMRVNLRAISAPAFALWILRNIRSIPGEHRIEIGGEVMPVQMPEAIDVIAQAVVNARRRPMAA